MNSIDARMTRSVADTMKILKNNAMRSTTNMFENSAPEMPAKSNQARHPKVTRRPATLKYARFSFARRGNEKSMIRTTQSQQVRKISGSSRRRSEEDSVSEKVIQASPPDERRHERRPRQTRADPAALDRLLIPDAPT